MFAYSYSNDYRRDEPILKMEMQQPRNGRYNVWECNCHPTERPNRVGTTTGWLRRDAHGYGGEAEILEWCSEMTHNRYAMDWRHS